MGPKIALLINGFPSDLAACVCSVQVAARAESRLFVLAPEGPGRSLPGSKSTNAASIEGREDFAFVAEFAALEGVAATCHLLGIELMEELSGFLITNSITCLVMGNWPVELQKAQQKWLGDLHNRLKEAPNRFYPDLQVIMAPLLEEAELEKIMSQSRRLSRIAGRRT